MNLFFFKTKKRSPIRRLRSTSRSERSINLGQQEIKYQLTLRPISRSIRMHIDLEKGLIVSAPMRTPLYVIENFIIQKKFWIQKNLEESQKNNQQRQILDGTSLSILDEHKTICIKNHQLQRTYVAEKADEINIYAQQNQAIIKKTLENYLRKKFKVHLTKRLKELSTLMKTPYGTVTIRAQKSRWGSCSHRNNLNFNWKLVFMPLAIIDYVIMHELAHTIHHNHSSQFYNFLSTYCPDYKRFRSLLNKAKVLF